MEKVQPINHILPDAARTPDDSAPFPHDGDPPAPIPVLGGIGRKP
ncbi:hypothetical protein [Spongiactinospora gelatinilytica]|nr:hypothetical protein [Spongiactinospora gelatinilytica]